MFLFIVLTLIVVLYIYLSRKLSYWKRRNVESFPPTIPFGNIADVFLLRRHYSDVLFDIYNEIKGPFAGIYFGLSPVLFIKDLDLVKDVLVKNFDSFQDRGLYYDEKDQPLTAHIFRLEGEKWKFTRQKMTPAFTSGKLKYMFSKILNCGKELEDVVKSNVQGGSSVISLKNIFQRFTTDVIFAVGFGIKADSLKNKDSEYYALTNATTIKGVISRFAMTTMLFIPYLLKILPLRSMPKNIEQRFIGLVEQTMKYRETNNIEENDFLQLLIRLKNFNSIDGDSQELKNSKPIFTMNELAAQSFVFYIAGLETSHLLLCHVFYFLAQHPDKQQILLDEIDSYLTDSEITYEVIAEMPYLDMCIKESLRLQPPLTMLNRITTKAYRIPNTDITIEKGVRVLIDILGSQMNPEYFPEPEKFKPERWDKGSVDKIPPFAYMPFGEGPRNCIGLRQGKIQTKVGLVSILKDHRVDFAEETKTISTWLSGDILNVPINDLYLKVSKR